MAISYHHASDAMDDIRVRSGPTNKVAVITIDFDQNLVTLNCDQRVITLAGGIVSEVAILIATERLKDFLLDFRPERSNRSREPDASAIETCTEGGDAVPGAPTLFAASGRDRLTGYADEPGGQCNVSVPNPLFLFVTIGTLVD
jgi:hypothetical protein